LLALCKAEFQRRIQDFRLGGPLLVNRVTHHDSVTRNCVHYFRAFICMAVPMPTAIPAAEQLLSKKVYHSAICCSNMSILDMLLQQIPESYLLAQ